MTAQAHPYAKDPRGLHGKSNLAPLQHFRQFEPQRTSTHRQPQDHASTSTQITSLALIALLMTNDPRMAQLGSSPTSPQESSRTPLPQLAPQEPRHVRHIEPSGALTRPTLWTKTMTAIDTGLTALATVATAPLSPIAWLAPIISGAKAASDLSDKDKTDLYEVSSKAPSFFRPFVEAELISLRQQQVAHQAIVAGLKEHASYVQEHQDRAEKMWKGCSLGVSILVGGTTGLAMGKSLPSFFSGAVIAGGLQAYGLFGGPITEETLKNAKKGISSMLLFAYPELTKNEARIAASSAVNVLFTIRGVGSSSRAAKASTIKGLPGQLSSVHAESARLVTEKSMEEGSSAAASTKRIIPGTNTEMLEALFQNPDSVTKQWLSGVFESHPEACESPQEPYEGISRPTEEQKKYIQELLAGASQATADVVTEAILFPQQNRADRQTDRDKSRSEKMGEPHQPKSTASPEQRMHHSSPIQEESPVIFQKENPLIVPTMDNAIRELAGHSVEGLAVFAQAIGNDRLATKIVDIGMGAMKFAENVQKISKIVHAASSIGKGVSTVMLASSIIGTVVTVFSTISSLFSSDDSSEAFQAVQRQIQRLEGVFIQGIDFLAQLNEEVRQEMIKGFGDAKDQMSQNQYFTMLGFLQSSRQSGEIQTILHVRTNELFRQIEATSSSHDQKLTSELMKETLAALSAIANHLVRASGKPLSEIPYDEAKRLCAILEDGLIANNTNSPVTIGMGAFNGAVYGDLSDNAIIKLSSSLTAGDQPGFFLRVLKDKFKLSSSLDPNMIPNLRLALHEALPYLELRSAMNPAYHYDDNGVMPKRIEEGVRRWYAFSEFARRPEVWEALYSYYDEAIRQFRPLLVEAAQEIEQEKFDLLVGSVPASQRSGRDLSTHRVSILFSVPEMLDGVDRHPLDERIHPIIGNPVPGLERLSPNDCERELNTDVVVGPNVHCDPTEPIRLQSGELCHLMVGTNVKVGRDDPSGYKFTCTQHKTERYGQYCDACTLTSAPRFPAPTEKCPDLKTSDGKDFAVQRLISQEDRLHEDMLISEMSLWYSANVEGGQFEAIASKQNGTVTRVGSINIGPGQKLGLVEGTMRRLNSERLQTMWRMGALQGGRPGARRLWEDKQKRDKTVEEIVEERLRWLCKAVSTLSTPGGVRSERWTAALKQLTAARALLYTFCQIAGVSEDECQKHFASLHTAKEMELYQDPAFWSSLGGKKPPLPPEADDVTVENRTAMIQDLFNRTDNLDTGPVLAPVAYLVKAFSDFESKHAQTVAEQLKNESDLPLQLSSAKSGDMASEISRLTQRVSELGKRLEKQTQEMKETKELLQRIEQHEAKLMEILQILQSNGCAAKD